MKITKKQLTQIIKEETEAVLNEQHPDIFPVDLYKLTELIQAGESSTAVTVMTPDQYGKSRPQEMMLTVSSATGEEEKASFGSRIQMKLGVPINIPIPQLRQYAFTLSSSSDQPEAGRLSFPT